MHDIVLLSVPFTIIEVPPLGIAVLKGAVESEGFRAKTYDLGMELFNQCGRNSELFDSLQEYFIQPDLDADLTIKKGINDFLDKWAKQLASMPTRYIGISIFSYYSHLAGYLLCQKIKNINPDKQIVIGGPGVTIRISAEMHDRYNITNLEKTLSYGEILQRRGLAKYISGDGEQALVDLLKQGQVSNNFQTIDYRNDAYPYANFDDFNLFDYAGQMGKGYPQLPIFSSKGCVRNCDFCDVNVIQNRFRFRTGKNIVQEMIYLAEKYGIRDFIFLDSLVNGSLKSMLEWVTELAQHNRDYPDKRITWSGSWICRPIGQIKPHVYKLLAESGCEALSIGAESGSNRVLEIMDKKTTVEALHYEAEQFYQNNIKFMTLLIAGHWSETWDDFVETCDMLYQLGPYARTGNYLSSEPGSGFAVIDDTPAYQNRTINKLEFSTPLLWWTSVNPSLTARERFYRALILIRLQQTLKIPLQTNIIPKLYWTIKNNIDEIKKYYSDKTGPEQFAETYYKDFSKLLNLLAVRNRESKFKIDLELLSTTIDSNPPMVEIIYNDQVLFDNCLPNGLHRLSFTCDTPADNLTNFSIRFYNKLPSDTVVDAQGNIVQDKFIELKKLQINKFDLLNDPEFFYNQFNYSVNGSRSDVKPGFWFNESVLSLSLNQPFDFWYCCTSNKHSNFSVYIVDQITLSKKQVTQSDQEYHDMIIELLDTIPY